MRELLKKIYRLPAELLRWAYCKVLSMGYDTGVFSLSDVPVILNNFNRLTFPLKLIEFLKACGMKNIIIIDNSSTYPPLLDFYRTTDITILPAGGNLGHLALWKSGLYRRFRWNYFIYSDADVLPVDDCPRDFVRRFKEVLDEYAHVDKVGFGIRIDDLPESFSLKRKVVEYESRYWQRPVADGVFDAPIDTTFAMYKPFSGLVGGHTFTRQSYRLGPPYLIRHLPWYVDSKNLSDEEKYYLESSNSSSSLSKQHRGNEVVY